MLQIIARSSFIIFFTILCVRDTSLASILDGRKCLVYEDVVTEAPVIEVEDIQTVLFNNHLPAVTKVKYGQHLKLVCDIYLPSSMNIVWKGRHRVLKRSLSDDSTELDIKSMNAKYHGEYITCEASMVSNPKIRNTFGTAFKISDLAVPKISELTPTKITVMENNSATLSCKIVAGVPPPQVSWQVKKNGGHKFKDLFISAEDFTVDSTSFADDGQYRCFAKNMKGAASKTIVVSVQKLPVAVIEGGTEKKFNYSATSEFTCRIEGNPLPSAVWKDNEGNELVSQDTNINWHEKISKLKLDTMKKSNNYSCFAENSLGNAVSSVNVTILSPFVVHEYPEEKKNVNYDAATNIVCNITSSFPMRIKWFRPKTANSSEHSEIHSDKQFKITSDETMLQIVSTDMDLVGNYTCIASLISDENEKIGFTTDVQIDNLASPLMSDANKITVMETNLITLYCKIVGGVPSPTLSWQVMRHGDTKYKDLSSTSEELDVDSITIADAGKYRCVAKNAIGEWSKTTEVQVRKAPVAVIEEGSAVSVPYGSNHTFKCRVIAYPLPNIAWKVTTGNILITEETEINEHEKTNEITVSEIKANKTYHCQAKNSLGQDTSRIVITVLSPFVVHQHPEDITNVHYAASTNLVCNITSSYPVKIKWYHNSTEVHTSGSHTISANETVLHINSIDFDFVGNYTCEATLIYDDSQKKAFTTKVRIDNLAPPQISELTPNKVTVMENKRATLSCKIVAGVPPPEVSWQVKRNGGNKFEDLSMSAEDFTVKSASFADDGQYRCFAKNMKGVASKTIVMTVHKLPVAVIEEGAEKTFNYSTTSEFNCRINGNPLPSAVWKDNKGNELASEDTNINWHEKISKLKLENMKKSNNYSCFAENSLGKAVSSVNVTILSPFVVHEYPEESTNVNYGVTTNIVCNISSSIPMRIKWFCPKTANSSEQAEIHTDKQFMITSDETVLQIVSIDMELVGNYTCIASLIADENEKISFTTDVQIDNLASPLINDANKMITVMETKRTTVNCTIIRGVPSPILSWQGMKHGETTYKDLSYLKDELDFDSITIVDAGKYRCVAKNVIGEWTKTTEVEVQKAPVAVIEEGAVSVPYGGNHTFECQVVSYPLPNIAWEVNTGNVLQTEETIINEHEKICEITVSDIKANDAYHCHANNSLGQDTSSVAITVLSPFVVHQHPEDISNVHYKASTDLVCNITSSYPMKIKWYYNSTEIHTSASHTISANETVVHINTMDLDQLGYYKCEATLVYDDSQKKSFVTQVQIDDLRPPVITHYNGPAVTVKNLEELSLVCNAMGYPDPVVTWQALLPGTYGYQNVGEGETLCSTNFGSAQAGTYLCMATNIVGQDSRTISVSVY